MPVNARKSPDEIPRGAAGSQGKPRPSLALARRSLAFLGFRPGLEAKKSQGKPREAKESQGFAKSAMRRARLARRCPALQAKAYV
jgi:hypothetical protein